MVKHTHIILRHKTNGKIKVLPRSRYTVRQKTLGWGAVGLLAGGLGGAVVGALGYRALRHKQHTTRRKK